jgi:tryptophan 2,3-dioxygenase
MSLIKPRARGKHLVPHRTRLDRDNHETLYAYAAFIAEEPEYVLNELIDTILAKDKEFVKWRREHTESFAPRPAAARKGETGQGGRERPSVGASSATGEARHLSES